MTLKPLFYPPTIDYGGVMPLRKVSWWPKTWGRWWTWVLLSTNARWTWVSMKILCLTRHYLCVQVNWDSGWLHHLREGITLMKRRMLNSAFWALFTSNQALEGYHHQRALLSEVKGDIFFTGELGPYILFPPLGSSQSGLFWQIIPPYSISFHPFLVNSFSFLSHSSTILAISTDFRMFPPHSFLF